MKTLPFRNLLSRVALAALLPLSITACDDDTTPSGSGTEGETENPDDDDTSDTNVTVTATTPTTMTDTTPSTDTETGDTETTDDTSGPGTDSASDTDATTGETESATGETESTTGETESATGETESTTGGETTGGMSACLEVSIDGPFVQAGAAYVASSFTPLGDADIEDVIRVEFYDLADGPLPEDGVDLASAGVNDNYISCDECFRALEDGGITVAPVRGYFQSQGTLTASEPVAAGTASLTFAGVRLVEVTIADDFTSTPVEDGACIDIVDGTYIALPPAWTCDATAYGDGATCDCGCGVVDPDCADATAGSCDVCDGVGSCAEAAMDCTPIAVDDNATCPPNPLCEDAAIAGELDGADPIFTRSFGVGAACGPSGAGIDVSYDVLTFTAPAGGVDITADTCDAVFDSYISLYQAADGSADPFDPLNPCVNLVGSDDDSCGSGTSILTAEGLVAGEYQVVVTQFDPLNADGQPDLGAYTMTQTCI